MHNWLKQAAFLQGLDDEASGELAALKPMVVEKKTVLFRPGDAPAGFVIVLSGRPARTQYVMDIDLPAERSLDVLYTPAVGDMLHTLRDQIRIAQGRTEEQAA